MWPARYPLCSSLVSISLLLSSVSTISLICCPCHFFSSKQTRLMMSAGVVRVWRWMSLLRQTAECHCSLLSAILCRAAFIEGGQAIEFNQANHYIIQKTWTVASVVARLWLANWTGNTHHLPRKMEKAELTDLPFFSSKETKQQSVQPADTSIFDIRSRQRRTARNRYSFVLKKHSIETSALDPIVPRL